MYCPGYYDENNFWQNGFPCGENMQCCWLEAEKKYSCCPASGDPANNHVTEKNKWDRINQGKSSVIKSFELTTKSVEIGTMPSEGNTGTTFGNTPVNETSLMSFASASGMMVIPEGIYLSVGSILAIGSFLLLIFWMLLMIGIWISRSHKGLLCSWCFTLPEKSNGNYNAPKIPPKLPEGSILTYSTINQEGLIPPKPQLQRNGGIAIGERMPMPIPMPMPMAGTIPKAINSKPVSLPTTMEVYTTPTEISQSIPLVLNYLKGGGTISIPLQKVPPNLGSGCRFQSMSFAI